MLLKASSVKSKFREANLRSSKEVVMAIDRCFDKKLTDFITGMKIDGKKTVTDYDVNTRMA